MEKVFAKDVMIREVYTIHPRKRVALARLRMLRHGVGALPVVDKKKKLMGIITLRDIDLAGTEAGALLVEDLMTTNLVTGREDTPIAELVEKMLRIGVQRIPIVDKDDKLVGLVTQTAVIRAAKKCFQQMQRPTNT